MSKKTKLLLLFNLSSLQVFCLLIFHLKPTGAFPRSGLDMEGSRTRRGVTCSPALHYLNGNICCLNCPAGKPHGATLYLVYHQLKSKIHQRSYEAG